MFKRFFKKSAKTAVEKAKTPNTVIHMDLKGQQSEAFGTRQKINEVPENHGFEETRDAAIILPVSVRFKVWRGLFFIMVYVYGLYRLILYRLKSDDLDIMEREVNEEVVIKKKVEEINKM